MKRGEGTKGKKGCSFSLFELKEPILFVLYIFLWSLGGIIIHESTTPDKPHIKLMSLVLVIEGVKAVIAALVYYAERREGSRNVVCLEVQENDGEYDYWKWMLYYTIPALCLAVNNCVIFFNLIPVDYGLYKVVTHVKIIIVGLFHQFAFAEKLGPKKWIAMFLLVSGCFVNRWGDMSFSIHDSMVIIAQSVLYSCGSVVNEYLLKKDEAMPVHLQMACLYSITIFFEILFICMFDYTYLNPVSLFENWRMEAIVPIVIVGSGGGLITSVLLKRLGAIAKEFAASAEMLSTSFLSIYFLKNSELDWKFTCSFVLIFSASYLFYYTRLRDWMFSKAKSKTVQP